MKRTSSALVKGGLFILYLVIALLIGISLYRCSYNTTLTDPTGMLPGLAISESQPTPQVGEGTPEAVLNPTQVAILEPDPWDGGSRVTILVMGLDYRDWIAGEGPPRTDTMILLTIDPLTMTAGMLNIPRDLWVNIPGYESGKINTAYALGETYQVPPYGGATLAIQTVEALLGVHIDYFAQIDFYAFERFIDELGGIWVDIPAEIKIDPLGDIPTNTVGPGLTQLDGPHALAYARARNTDGGDFDRSTRQQDVIMAIVDRIIELGPAQLLSRAPALYEELSSGVHTNLALNDALRLGWLALDARDHITRAAIAPPNAVLLAKTPDGSQDILIPVPDQVRLVRDQVFASSNMASPVLGSGDPQANMQSEAAAITVLNGSYVEGLAGRTQEYLLSQGANVISTGNGEYTTYTRIIDYTGNPYTVRYLVELMAITRYSIFFEYDPASPVDVVVIVGDDWAANNPMP